MFQFGNQVEFRVDRRHLLFLAMGAILWTFLTFFLGLWAASEQGKQPIKRGLRLLGWLDRQRAEDPLLPSLASSQVTPPHKETIRFTKPHKMPSVYPRPQKARVVPPAKRAKDRPKAAKPPKDRAKAAKPPRRQASLPPQIRPEQPTPERPNPPEVRKVSQDKRIAQEKKQRLLKYRMAPWNRARYALQLRFSSDFKTLRRLQKRFSKKGYPAPMLTREVFRKKRYFRLTLGAFRSRQQAQSYLRLFQQVERTTATIHKIR
ncbi:MAG: SPOR domain-containing protein [Myxococcales bacterium]|nr:SPOR domain-containing protein [Myxococcales bacterium]